MRCFADAQHDGQTIFVYRWSLIVYRKNEKRWTRNETTRAFCLASATHLGSVILSVSEGSPGLERFER
ncbi:MAG: hypothetical protein KGP35_03360 [Bacteroidetes bacterium]|nr:hypothetical protein [Bacteroidota bacterium]